MLFHAGIFKYRVYVPKKKQHMDSNLPVGRAHAGRHPYIDLRKIVRETNKKNINEIYLQTRMQLKSMDDWKFFENPRIENNNC